MSVATTTTDYDAIVFTTDAIAAVMGVHYTTVLGWIRGGTLVAMTLGNARNRPTYRVTAPCLERFLVSRGLSQPDAQRLVLSARRP